MIQSSSSRRPKSTEVVALVATFVLFLACHAFAQKVPSPHFEAKLLFSPPEIEHPSVVACDDAGNLFVGEDPMDMRGLTTKEFDRIVLMRWQPDGSAKRTVFAENLSAVFGLAWLDGWLYVMHAPHYSRFRDADGDGVAELREELADGFGPPAGVFGFNDHIVTGTRLGMDGRLYVSVGDKGIQKAVGKDGSTITLEGGGVVRMKPDGTKLEIVSTGTRNHLDVAMDSRDNIFTYDNTDDGLGWWTRFTHHVPSGYYGYPFDYHNRPERHLPRISEHGGGSPCGGACYREAAWPKPYRDAPFFAEWGKGKVQCFHVRPSGATFTGEIEDFMVQDGPEPFRPVDLCFSPDGKHMYVADWNYAGWTNPTIAGRIYRVTYVGDDVPPEPPRTADDAPIHDQIRSLAHPAHSERVRAQRTLARLGPPAIAPLRSLLEDPNAQPFAKIHAIWAQYELAECDPKYDPTASWTSRLSDTSPDVRGQAARALGELSPPSAVGPLVQSLRDSDPGVRMRAAIALGRIGDRSAVPSLVDALDEQDPFARFTMIQSIRKLADWQAVLDGLRKAASPPKRDALLLTATAQYDEGAVRVLATWAKDSPEAKEGARATAALAEVHLQAASYERGWWGTRPAAQDPPRPKTQPWAGTPIVLDAVRAALADRDSEVRAVAVRAFQKLPADDVRPTIRKMAETDPNEAVRKEVFATLATIGDPDAVPLLVRAARADGTSNDLRSQAVESLVSLGKAGKAGDVAPALAELTTAAKVYTAIAVVALEGLASFPSNETIKTVTDLLEDPRPEIRAKAIDVLAGLKKSSSIPDIERALGDASPAVRQAAARQLGQLAARDAIPSLIKATSDPDTRYEATLALGAIPDARAFNVYLDGLADKSQDVRSASQTALIAIREQVADQVLGRARRGELSNRARTSLHLVYSVPQPIRSWRLVGAWPKADGQKPEFDTSQAPADDAAVKIGDRSEKWRDVQGDSSNGKVDLRRHVEPKDSAWALAFTTIEAGAAGKHVFQVGSDDQIEVWVDGKRVFEFAGARGWSPNQDSFQVDLAAGQHLVYALVGNDSGPWEFSMRVTQRDPRFDVLLADAKGKSDIGEVTEFAMSHAGRPDRGKALFNDLKGVGCAKCHAVGGGNAKVLAGPDLLGVGSKYDRRELIRSVLEPSNRLLSGYEMTIVATADGQVVQGVVKREDDKHIELIDVNGKTVTIPVEDIEQKTKSDLSLMPNGLAEGMTAEDFADIVAYLESLRETPATGK